MKRENAFGAVGKAITLRTEIVQLEMKLVVNATKPDISSLSVEQKGLVVVVSIVAVVHRHAQRARKAKELMRSKLITKMIMHLLLRTVPMLVRVV